MCKMGGLAKFFSAWEAEKYCCVMVSLGGISNECIEMNIKQIVRRKVRHNNIDIFSNQTLLELIDICVSLFKQ